MQVIAVDNLVKTFRSDFLVRKIEAVKGISFAVNSGEVFGLVGHNGAGKTTTIKMLVGLTFPTSGEAMIFGSPSTYPPTRQRIGFLPERPYFYEHLTAREALRFYGGLHNSPRKKLDSRIDELVEMVGLTGQDNRAMKSFSKGMLQRLGMAATILHDPELIILDEPMSGLDPLGRSDIKRIIHGLKNMGRTILFSSHILSDVEELCDRVGLMAHGELKTVGSVLELTEAYGGHSYEIIVSDTLPPEQIDPSNQLADKIEKVQDGLRILVTIDKRNALIDHLRSMDADILRMNPCRVSLEEVFVSGTGEGR